MLKIRLTRTGKKNSPSYRVVIANQRSKRDGDFIEYVGIYDPKSNPKKVEFNKEAIKGWMDKGAEPTETVRNLLIRAGVITKPKKDEIKVYKMKPGKKVTLRTAKKTETK
jgi:small subunit ribosomal protein S16